MTDKDEKKIVIGRLTEAYVNIPKKIEKVNIQINEIARRLTGIGAVSYGTHVTSSKTNDEKLAEMIDKLDDLEKYRDDLENRQRFIFKSLGIYNLDERELIVLEAVYKTKSYKEAGEKIGYSKTQIYRVMEEIYKEMVKYI